MIRITSINDLRNNHLEIAVRARLLLMLSSAGLDDLPEFAADFFLIQEISDLRSIVSVDFEAQPFPVDISLDIQPFAFDSAFIANQTIAVFSQLANDDHNNVYFIPLHLSENVMKSVVLTNS